MRPRAGRPPRVSSFDWGYAVEVKGVTYKFGKDRKAYPLPTRGTKQDREYARLMIEVN